MGKSLLQISYIVAGSASDLHYIDDNPNSTIEKTFGGLTISTQDIVASVSVPEGVTAPTQIGNNFSCDSIVLVDSSYVTQLRSLQMEILNALRSYVTADQTKWEAQSQILATGVKVTSLYKEVKAMGASSCVNC